MDRFVGLSVFVAVDNGSLAAAARAHGITPAMAGKHVAAIEAELGVRLLQRTTRKLHPTDIGLDYRRSILIRVARRADRASRVAPTYGTLVIFRADHVRRFYLGRAKVNA